MGHRWAGQGQYIDQSQAESTLHFLAPAILDYTVNGRVQERVGNRDPAMAPHGAYPAAGEDCWIAITVGNDQQWQALCAVLERSDLLHDERFTTPEARLAHQDALDTIVAAWTTSREARVAEVVLQMRGVPASALQNSRELCDDPQLAHRGHLVRLAHPILGTTIVEGSRFRLSRTPAKIDCAAPTLGGDNHYVLETILGYSEERIAELVIEGALE